MWDNSMFATGAREGEKIWYFNEGKYEEHSKISNTKANTTAISFFPRLIRDN